jgi:hypothetical protein
MDQRQYYHLINKCMAKGGSERVCKELASEFISSSTPSVKTVEFIIGIFLLICVLAFALFLLYVLYRSFVDPPRRQVAATNVYWVLVPVVYSGWVWDDGSCLAGRDSIHF